MLNLIDDFESKTLTSGIIALLLVCIGLTSSQGVTAFETLPQNDRSTTSSLLFSDPISISSDTSFLGYGFSGVGTEEDPFMIEGLQIGIRENMSTETAIVIENTVAFFIIRNCSFGGYIKDDVVLGYGVTLENVTNGVIRNCTFDTLDRGISIWGAVNLKIDDCLFTSEFTELAYKGFYGWVPRHRGEAIRIDEDFSGTPDAYNIEVTRNTIQNYGSGILAYTNSRKLLIDSNILVNCSKGIAPRGCQQLIISNNTCFFTLNEAISFDRVNNSIVTMNRIQDTLLQGMVLYYSCHNNITFNKLIGNGPPLESIPEDLDDIEAFGLQVGSRCTNNRIIDNDFANNTFDVRNNYDGNIYDYNFYSDYAGQDLNNDLIGDSPYQIDGYSPTEDAHPRMASIDVEVTHDSPFIIDTEIIAVVAVVGSLLVIVIFCITLRRK